MKYKKIISLAIFFVSLLAISAASAADNTTEVIIANAGEDVVSVENNNLTVEQTENEETIGATDDGTFTALQNKIDNAVENSTVTLENDYAYDEGFGNDRITIAKSLTIVGNGHTIDALKKSEIFRIIQGSNVVLNNIKFCNGNYDNGGAISCYGNSIIKVSDCVFVNNSAKNHGGAIFNYDGNALYSGCIFVKNSGGAIYNGNAVNCSFVKNSGGAIYNGNAVNCSFVNNSGRAIYEGSAVNCSFVNNSGRAINSGDAVNCIFINNHGGAIYNGNAKNCNFTDNSAEYGGAIYSGYAVNCIFVNNSAYGSYGGGGAIESGNAVNCIFINNHAEYDGGAIYSGDAKNCNFIGNSAGCGGAIFCDGTVEECSFVNNSARYGGAIYYGSLSHNSLYVKKCTFINNVAGTGFNAYHIDYPLRGSESNNLKNVKFVDCNFQGEDLINTCILKWDDNKLILRLDDDEKGSVSIKISGKTFHPTYETIGYRYYAYFDIKGIEPGINEVNIFYEGDSTDNPIEITLPVYIGSQISISSSDVEMYFGKSNKFTVTLKEGDASISGESVDITVNGKTSSVKTDSKGHASIDLDLPVGEYEVTAVYNGVSTTSKVTVKSTVTVNDAAGNYLNSKVSATFLDVDGKDLASKRVTFKAGDKTYAATTNNKGVATADVDLGSGTYTVTATNPVNNEQKQFKLIIGKASSAIALASSQINGVTTLTATLTPAAATGNVVFNVNGEDKTVAVKNGKATLTLSDLDPGDYAVTASYNGDKNLNASTSSTVTFNVTEVYPILAADPVTKTYGTSTKLVVNLVDSKGNAIANADVSVVIGSATKHIKTDSNGQATMTISLKPATYTANITYLDAQTTAKINVKKATPKLTAKAKTFKKSLKTKKYTITLKTNTNKVMINTKVTLKVNGKTYKATTNSKGKATFKITKLTKKGKFNAVIKFAGNSYYKMVTKTIRITVKK